MTHLQQFVEHQIYKDMFRRSIHACRNKLIPTDLFSPKEIRNRVSKISFALQHKGYAVSVRDPTELLKLPVTDCVFTKNSILAHIRVPLRQKMKQWRIYEIVHVKFGFQNQTCEIFPQESSYVAQSSNQVVLINSHLLRHCPVDQHRLCLIPRNARESSQSLTCTAGMLKNLPVIKLAKSCSFTCSKAQELVITEINPRLVVLTNANEIKMTCNGKTKVFTPERVGALEMKLSCHCSYEVDGSILQPPFPCPAGKKCQFLDNR